MDQALILELERLSTAAKPAAERQLIEGWELRLGRGAVGRLNSVTTFGARPYRLFETIETVERRYQNRQRPVRFRITPLDDELDELLDARGYQRSEEVLVMTMPTSPVEPDPTVEFKPGVTKRWLDGYRRCRQDSEERVAEIGESLAALSLHHVAAIAEASVGVAVREGGWIGLFDISVAAEHRRQGRGGRMSRQLIGWGHEQGAIGVYLQASETNLAARGLYESMGFHEVYRYWYRDRF